MNHESRISVRPPHASRLAADERAPVGCTHPEDRRVVRKIPAVFAKRYRGQAKPARMLKPAERHIVCGVCGAPLTPSIES